MIDAGDALKGLSALVGAGGLSGVIIAILAHLTEARKGRKPSDGSVSIAIERGWNVDKWGEVHAGHLATISYAMVKMVAINEIKAEEAINDKSFHDRMETKITRLMIEAIRASTLPSKGVG